MAKVAKMVKKEKVDVVAQALALAAAKPEVKKAKSNVVEIPVTSETRQLVDNVIALQVELDATKADLEINKFSIMEEVKPIRSAMCAEEYVNSIRVCGTEGKGITISWANSYNGTIDSSKAEEIESVLGGTERFNDFFTKDVQVELKEATDSALRTVIEAIGPVKFAELFSVKTTYVPKEQYTKDFFRAFTADEREALSELVPQRAAAIKVK